MGDLLNDSMKQADANALAELDGYERVFPEHRALAADRRSRAETLDYAVWFRRRTVELTRPPPFAVSSRRGCDTAMGKQWAAQANAGGRAACRQSCVFHARVPSCADCSGGQATLVGASSASSSRSSCSSSSVMRRRAAGSQVSPWCCFVTPQAPQTSRLVSNTAVSLERGTDRKSALARRCPVVFEVVG